MLSPLLFRWRFFPCFAPRFAVTPIATVSLELFCAGFIEIRAPLGARAYP